MVIERSGDAEDDGIHFGNAGEVVSSGKPTGGLRRGYLIGRDMLNVRPPGCEGSDFGWVNVKADDVETRADVS